MFILINYLQQAGFGWIVIRNRLILIPCLVGCGQSLNPGSPTRRGRIDRPMNTANGLYWPRFCVWGDVITAILML